MKRIICWLSILCFSIINFSGCKSTKAKNVIENDTKIKGNIILKNVVKRTNLYSVSIDPKIELLGIVQYLAEDKTIVKESSNQQATEYSNDINKYFSKFKNEPVVELYKEMNEKDFAYDVPPNFMLYVGDKFNIIKGTPLPDDIAQKAEGKDTITKFLNGLKDFYTKSKFSNFYAEHSNFYKQIVSEFEEKLNKTNCINELVNYYGYKQNSYNIIIEPLSSGGYGVKIANKNSKFDLYAFVSLNSSDIDLTNLIVHEFGHSYVNPLTEKYKDDVDKLSYLFEPIRKKMESQAYGEWSYCVNEHIVRAITYRILYKLYGSTISQNYLKNDNDHSFIYIYNVYNKLDEYEKNRERYLTFSDFYPVLLNSLK